MSRVEEMEVIGLRAFSDVLADIGGGDMDARLTRDLAEIVEAVNKTGKAGKLTLTVNVGRDGKMIRVAAVSKATVPKDSVEATAFFADERGGLHRENPRQGKILLNGRPIAMDIKGS